VGLSLFLENRETDVVVVVPLEPGQENYSAVVPAGTYRAYAWLPDLTQMGAYSACGEAPCTDHSLLWVEVAEGESVAGVDLADWFVPASPLIAISGRLIDGSGADPVEDATLVIWGFHIVAVAPEDELEVPVGAKHYRLYGSTILPGFINTHVHNAYSSRNLETWAESGVTTVRDVGARVGSPWDTWRTRFEDDPRYARILAAGPLVTCPDGYPIIPNGFSSLTVDSPAEARDEINQLIDRGADVIKIVIESGVQEVLSGELATIIVDTAHDRGIPVTVHLVFLRDLRTALDAGVDDIGHMVLDHVPDSLIQRMVADDVGWVPTMAALDGNGTPMYDNLQRFIAAGGRVALGNDAGFIPGLVIGMPLPELEAMEQAGMTPRQIIVAATSDAAIVCHRQDLIGSLEPGKLADVLVVNGDPLTDLRVLEDVRMVMHGGEIIRFQHPTPRRLRRVGL
jgi:imidazolonepropionase-like amidohydrolase